MIQKKIEQLTKNRLIQMVNFIVLFMMTSTCVMYIVLLTIQYIAILYQEQPTTFDDVKHISIMMGSLLALVNILAGVLITCFISISKKQWNKFFKKNKKD